MLPYSTRVNIEVLSSVYSKTTTSYKYLFFLSLLDVLKETGFNSIVIPLDELLLHMLASAWYPHAYFRLSFGVNDRIARQLDALNLDNPERERIGPSAVRLLREEIARKNYSANSLLSFVPYRLIAPFFARELQRVKETDRNRMIKFLASKQFETTRPFYRFTDDGKSIIMHQEWMLYLYENHQLVHSFIAWNWLGYMQRRNPSVPNIQRKLFVPLSRESMARQTDFFKRVLAQEHFTCIYSGKDLTLESCSLDHFLPWSFIAHDQLWNLVPVDRSINSSKSDHLPSLDRYFSLFSTMQHRCLHLYHRNPGKTPWHTIIEPYIADLKLKPAEVLDLDKLSAGLRSVIEPLSFLASSQGFTSDWEYPCMS